MTSTFGGFSEEDLKRIKSGNSSPQRGLEVTPDLRKIDKLGAKPKRTFQYKTAVNTEHSDDSFDNVQFEKCKLSIKPPLEDVVNNNFIPENITTMNHITENNGTQHSVSYDSNIASLTAENSAIEQNVICDSSRRNSTEVEEKPDIVRGVDNYTEDDLVSHRQKLEELQLQQRLMEEQNKKRKEMLARALADRTKQTAQEVVRLEKIKKELQVLDGQFSSDVSVLRKKIDQACLSYADAEKHYLKVEKEFLQAKIQLQKEKENKELLTEHLCALITHNETRKAQKLETLMLELATDRRNSVVEDMKNSVNGLAVSSDEEIDKPEIVDGVDLKTGKFVELNTQS